MLKDITHKLQTDGAVGVIATDTLYGLVARAGDQTAVQRLYAFKKRENKPGTVIAANIDQLVELGIKRRYLTAVEQFWPNPLSVIIPAGPELDYLHQGKHSLAIRIPKDQRLQKFLLETGPLLTTSANHPGETPASTIAQARDYFGDEVDFYQDGGDLSEHKPSTIIRIIDDAIEVVRPGAVTIDEAGRISNEL